MIEKIAELIIDTAMQELVPRFRALAAHEIEEKGPGDVVTVADKAAEARLTAGLLARVPGCTVIGEEAAHADPARSSWSIPWTARPISRPAGRNSRS
jgi:fructose-1,6-bisphosphatase/inositol monophosphatase family enzyme